jgi:hypothetical protein
VEGRGMEYKGIGRRFTFRDKCTGGQMDKNAKLF